MIQSRFCPEPCEGADGARRGAKSSSRDALGFCAARCTWILRAAFGFCAAQCGWKLRGELIHVREGTHPREDRQPASRVSNGVQNCQRVAAWDVRERTSATVRFLLQTYYYSTRRWCRARACGVPRGPGAPASPPPNLQLQALPRLLPPREWQTWQT